MKKKAEEIMDVALKLFASEGYHATSMRAIAKEANIVPSSIYNHFKSKEAVLIEIVLAMKDEISKTFEFEETLSKREKYEAYRKNIVRSLKEKTEFWRLIHTVRMNAGIMHVIGAQTMELQNVAIQKISNLIGEKKRPASLEKVLLFWAAIDGIVAAFLLIKDYPLEKILKELFKKYE